MGKVFSENNYHTNDVRWTQGGHGGRDPHPQNQEYFA